MSKLNKDIPATCIKVYNGRYSEQEFKFNTPVFFKCSMLYETELCLSKFLDKSIKVGDSGVLRFNLKLSNFEFIKNI